MNSDFPRHVKNMLLVGKELIISHPTLTKETGDTNIKGDKTLEMDKLIEQSLINYVKENNLAVDIFSEEIGMVHCHDNPTHLMVFDPLDGSTNYQTGKNILPYGLLISCYEGLTPKLNDVIAAGSIEHITGLGFLFDGTNTTTLDGDQVSFEKKWTINQKTSVYFDLYYKKAYDAFAPLAQKLHIRWNGSNVSALTYTLSEVSAMMGAFQMRPEEIGTMVALIKGAGGIAVNLAGYDLGEELFSIDKTYQLLAGNKDVVKFALTNLQ